MPDIASLSIAFLVYAGLVAAVTGAILLRAFRGASAAVALATLVAWVGYAGMASWLGWLGDPALRPPGIARLLAPILAALILIIFVLPSGRRLAASLSIPLLIAFQVFRVGVELVVAELHRQGLVAHLLTLGGGNVDLLVAVSAPLFAWLATRGTTGLRIAFAWNVLGLLSVLNVSARAALSTPGPLNLIHTEVPTVAFASFPFGLVPGFIVPLALALHLVTFRALWAGRSQRIPAGEPTPSTS